MMTSLDDSTETTAAPVRRRRRKDDEELADQGQLTDEEISAPGRAWYFVHTYSGHENKVRHAVRATVEQMDAKDRVFHVVVPTEDEIEIREGQRRTVKRKLYPGYVLVQTVELDLESDDADRKRIAQETFYMIRNTTGVTGFVSAGDRPVPLSKDEVNHILRAMRMEQPRIRIQFTSGQSVRIITGPFEDFVGTVDDIDTEKGKVRVLVNMFGRETPVTLDFLEVERL
ncbi:MAG: transcription termination/antitermination protein NusG [Dehalococcoidia bacterium]